MFCSECGAEATGHFCWRCGAQLHAQDPAETAHPISTATADAPAPAPPVDWSVEVHYAVLKEIPEVRERIANAGAGARRGMSADEFLELGDKLLGSSFGTPIKLGTLTDLIVPVYERLGIRTGKRRIADLEHPVGRLIVAVLCSLASRSMTIDRVHQAEDGCAIEAKVPSSPRAFKPIVVATIRRRDAGSQLEAAVSSQGQLYDWGLSKSILRNLFDDVARYAPPDIVG